MYGNRLQSSLPSRPPPFSETVIAYDLSKKNIIFKYWDF